MRCLDAASSHFARPRWGLGRASAADGSRLPTAALRLCLLSCPVLCSPLLLQGGCSGEFLTEMAQGDCVLLNRNCTLLEGRSPAQGVVSGGERGMR